VVNECTADNIVLARDVNETRSKLKKILYLENYTSLPSRIPKISIEGTLGKHYAKNYHSWWKFDKVMPKSILTFLRHNVFVHRMLHIYTKRSLPTFIVIVINFL